ncbi:MAG: hypothetical protein CMO97_02025 [Woeseia sp.]|nr:hypothetical protein [Woeseia sp.]
MPKYDENGRPEFELVRCADGFSMSVQASTYNYCSPRNNTGPWDSVEVGFPSDYEHCLMPYAEEPDRPTETVCGYVPNVLVRSIIEVHGGLVSGEVPPIPFVKETENSNKE